MKPILFILSMLCLTAEFSSWGAQAYTLDQCYALALKRSETLSTQTELIIQAEEHYQQARGGLFPTLNGVASETWQQSNPSATGNAIFPTTQPLIKLTAAQPLFRGLREFAGLRQTEGLKNVQTEAWRSAAVSLYKDVAQSFYTVISTEKDLENIHLEFGQYSKRQKELKQRVQIGRSRVTESLTVEAAQATLEAQSEQLNGQLRAARETLSFLTGLDSHVPIRDEELPTSKVDPLDKYLHEIENRPDVRTESARTLSAHEGINLAKGAHLPSVDLFGNYYFLRSGSLKDVSWDFQVALTLPIYAGGTIESRVRESASLERQADLSLSRVRRAAEQEIRTLHDTVHSDQKQVHSLQKATQLAEQNSREQSKEYRLGLVTNLDALQALTTFEETKRALDRARYNLKVDFLKLDAAAVKRPSLPIAVPIENSIPASRSSS